MKKQTKLLVILLSVALVLAGLVIAVSADTSEAKIGSTSYPTLAEAVNAANAVTDGSTTTITLTSDVTLDAALAFGEVNVVLDLNGHSFTSTASQAITVKKTNLTIKGTGTVTVEGAFVYDLCATASTGKTVNIGSDDGIINITHNATVKCDSSNYYAIRIASGNWNVKNLKISSTIPSSCVVMVQDKAQAVNFSGLEIKTTKNITNQSTAIFKLNSTTADVDFKNCHVDTRGASIIYIVDNMEHDITIDGMNAIARYDAKGMASFIGSYNEKVTNNIIVSNSVISENTRTQLKWTTNGSAIILRNSTLEFNGGGGTFFRSFNVKLEAGSALYGTHATNQNTKLFDMYDLKTDMGTPLSVTTSTGETKTNVNMIIYEGARFSELVYQRLVTGNYNDGQVVYEDGSDPKSSTTYKIVYRPCHITGAPYVVVKASEPDVEIPEYKYFATSPSSLFNWNDSGSKGTVKTLKNSYWQFRSTGGTKTPNYIFGLAEADFISQADYNVFVFDVDFAADTLNGFSPFGFALHSRYFDAAGTNKGGSQVNIFDIARDGSLSLNRLNGGDVTTMQLELGKWHHVTMVVDTTPTNGIVYVYVDGVYVGSSNAYSIDESTYDTRLSGVRFDVTGAKTGNESTNLLVDNVAIRTFGDLTVENAVATAITDKGESYLFNGGAAWNTEPAYTNTISSYFGYCVNGLDAALEMNSYVKLNSNIELPQTVTKEGSNVFANGKNITLAADSMPAYATRDASGAKVMYSFGSEYDTVNYKFFLGDHRSATQLADESNWITLKYIVGDNPADVYTNAYPVVDRFLPDSKNHYRTSSHNGWSENIGETVSSTVALTAEYAEENNGKTVVLYPTYNVAGGKGNNYYLIILDVEGIPRKFLTKEGATYDYGVTSGTLYGSNVRAFDMAYGETLVFQKNTTFQTVMTTIWSGSGGSSEDKVINVDLSGCTVTYDPNAAQVNGVNGKNDFIYVYKGETLNLYSSVPGGKIVTYGIHSDKATTTTATYASGDANIPTAGTTYSGTNKVEVTHTTNDDGTITVTTKTTPLAPSGGRLIAVCGDGKRHSNSTITENANGAETKHNTHVNIGTVKIGGKIIPGSNLYLESSSIIDMETGDSTCSVNIDGATVARNSSDYNGMFVVRKYFGEFNVTNATVIEPLKSDVLCYTADGYKDENGDGISEAALSTTLFDNTVIIVNNPEQGIINNSHSAKSVTFKNCTTNGRLNGSTIKQTNVVLLAEGNTYVKAAIANVSGVTKVDWNKPMTVNNGEVIKVNYFTLKPDNAYNKGDFDYNINTITIVSNGYDYAAAEGETVITLPLLTGKTVKNEDVLKVTYTNAETGKVTTKNYAEGGMFTLEAPEAGYVYNGEFIDATFAGTWTVNGVSGKTETVYTVNEHLTFVPDYTNVTYTFDKPQVNLSLAADFSINLFVPVAYKAYVASIVESGVALEATEVDTNEDGVADYIMVTIAKKATEATDNAVFTINLKDGPLTVTETATISIAAYAEKILDGAYDADDKALMYYILNYTKEAETYFDKAADAEALANIAKKYTGKTVEIDHNYVALDTSTFAGTIADATVLLEDVPKFRFTLASGFTGNVTIDDGKNERGSFDITADGSKEIVIDTIKAYNFDKTLYIKVTPTAEEGKEAVTTTYEYNLATFAAYHTAQAAKGNANSEAALNVIGALYDYAKVAYMYKTGTLAAAVTE